MTKYREIIRLHSLNFSERNIALSCSVSRNTVSKVLKKAAEMNISWPLDETMTVFCKHFLEKSAKYFWRMLHLQIGESCKVLAGCS